MTIEQMERIRIVRNQDGLYLHFGPNAMILLDAILEDSPPIVREQVRAFCERIAEPPEALAE